MTVQHPPDSLPVPDANSEKGFLVNALRVWLSAHGKPIPDLEDLRQSIIYSPPGDEEKNNEEEWIDVDGG